MPIYAREPESHYRPAPEGLHHAVLCDVIDKGLTETRYGTKDLITLVWQLGLVDDQTNERYVVKRTLANTLGENSTLRKLLESWANRKLTRKDMPFDLERLLGVNCQLQIQHALGEDQTVWANVQTVVPAPAGAPRLVVEHYEREAGAGQKDRPAPFPVPSAAPPKPTFTPVKAAALPDVESVPF